MKRLALLLLLLLAAPASAQQLPLGSEITALVTAPDGSAWALSTHDAGWSLSHAAATFTTIRSKAELSGLAIGPDGTPWVSGDSRVLFRADGALTRVGALPEAVPSLGPTFATGPDGTLWALLAAEEPTLARMDRFGRTTFAPIPAPRCTEYGDLTAIARASDGAMWIAARSCGELIRVTPAGAWSTVEVGADQPAFLAADASSGVWYATEGGVGHADASGTVRHTPLPERPEKVTGLAVGPDGAAHIATGSCLLGRALPGQAMTLSTPPIPALHIAFAPDGTRWLASRTRLVQGESGATCDDDGPRVTVSARRMRFATLKRRGVRFTVRERAVLTLFVGDADHEQRHVGRRLVYRPSSAALARLQRRLDRRHRTWLYLSFAATDADGNTTYADGSIRVTR